MVNVFLDNFSALLWRLYELPTPALLLGLALAVGLAVLVARRLSRRWAWLAFGQRPAWAAALFLLLAFLIILDQKFTRMALEYELLSDRYYAALLQAGGRSGQPANSAWAPQLQRLGQTAGAGFEITSFPLNRAADLVLMRRAEPPVSLCLALVDLSRTNLEVVLTPDLSGKSLTSRFAKENHCFVAINGEAGVAPGRRAPLGEWTGSYIVKGRPLLPPDPRFKRPWLGFSSACQATYFPAEPARAAVTPEPFNAIWGRWDILLNGVVQPLDRGSQNRPQPRTIMGVNQAGNLLYLMVVDGRQRFHSHGLSLREAAEILRQLGAAHAMACDEGGSSCMYLEKFGLFNRPADGRERPTYTHFGLRLNPGAAGE
jgi:hypothetical protein